MSRNIKVNAPHVERKFAQANCCGSSCLMLKYVHVCQCYFDLADLVDALKDVYGEKVAQAFGR